MSSDYEAATFLLEVLKQNGVEGPARAPFFKVVSGLSSGYERGRVLQAVVQEDRRQRRHAARGAAVVRRDERLRAVAAAPSLAQHRTR